MSRGPGVALVRAQRSAAFDYAVLNDGILSYVHVVEDHAVPDNAAAAHVDLPGEDAAVYRPADYAAARYKGIPDGSVRIILCRVQGTDLSAATDKLDEALLADEEKDHRKQQNGHAKNGRQRYYCRSCRKTFTDLNKYKISKSAKRTLGILYNKNGEKLEGKYIGK